MRLQLNFHFFSIIFAILIIVGLIYYFHSKSASSSKKEGSHPINKEHGTLEVWLSSTCPWCKKQVAMFESEGIKFEEQKGSPPSGEGVPQTRSKATGKTCTGFQDHPNKLSACLKGD